MLSGVSRTRLTDSTERPPGARQNFPSLHQSPIMLPQGRLILCKFPAEVAMAICF